MGDELASQCKTVLDTTIAETETYPAQVEDFAILAKDHLDDEIRLYEQILIQARTSFGINILIALLTVIGQPRSSSSNLSVLKSLFPIFSSALRQSLI
ncbi:hypothetical protein BDP27DRAFT_1418145 [Rhodocollybia butyracea]|uniref:Uncharacterized protein n=1 Tax=Rhodocollybia butyracea TaxID=206335 RepID=A0A9P5Q172_9AGAR|nr:hypothetical protein BDP27DRAFT_1418145 [Rhodocollybia butyracea]